MLLLTWVALVFFLFAVGVTAVRAGIYGWRAFKKVGAAAASAGDKLEMVLRSADDVAERAARLPEGSERLARALASLAVSRAELGLLLSAVARVRRTVDGVTGFVYGKS